MKNLPFLGFYLLAGLVAWSDGPAIRIEESWSNIMAGRPALFHLRVEDGGIFSGQVQWQVTAGNAVLARGGRAVTDKDPAVVARIDIPSVKPGGAVMGSLAASFVPESGVRMQEGIARPLWFLSDKPFAGQEKWTKGLKIRLFDPERKTAAIFDQAKITYEPVETPDAMEAVKDGLLIVGEGVSVRDYKGLPELAAGSARAGAKVLVLASAEKGEWPIPLGVEKDAGILSIEFKSEKVICELDKRLDADGWAPDGKSVATALAMVGERGGVAGEFRGDGAGWPWVDIRLASGGRILLCGFGIVRRWADSPTPAFLLAGVLKELEKGNRKNEEGERL